MTRQTGRYDNIRTDEVIGESTRDDKITEGKRGLEDRTSGERGRKAESR